jgi:transposase
MKKPTTKAPRKATQKPPRLPRKRVFAGIDVGKDWLDVALDEGGESLRRPNTHQGRADIVAFLREADARRVGLEASGGYEIEMVEALREAGFAVIVFQPRQVRAFATYLGVKAKTDTIDARLIARCTAAGGKVRAAPDPRLAALAEPLTFLEQIEEDIARLRTRRERYRDGALIAELEADIAKLVKRRQAHLAALLAAARAHADLARRLDLLTSIDGIGERTALTLLVRMPELGTLTQAEAGALAGMAPFTRRSGRWEGESHVEGGRARVGKALFAAAQAAAQRWNKHLVELYGRLTAKGKHHSKAVVACARKLAIYANAVLARDTPWVSAGR